MTGSSHSLIEQNKRFYAQVLVNQSREGFFPAQVVEKWEKALN